MKTRAVIISIILGAVVLLSVLALYVRVGATADSVAILKTRGMTCSSCSGKISNALEKLKGVAVTEVDVEGGWVVVGYETKTIKPEILAETVNGTGFASTVNQILTPAQFEQITGRVIGKNSASSSGCCSGKGGGCGSNKSK